MNKGGRVYIYLAALIDEIKLFSCQQIIDCDIEV